MTHNEWQQLLRALQQQWVLPYARAHEALQREQIRSEWATTYYAILQQDSEFQRELYSLQHDIVQAYLLHIYQQRDSLADPLSRLLVPQLPPEALQRYTEFTARWKLPASAPADLQTHAKAIIRNLTLHCHLDENPQYDFADAFRAVPLQSGLQLQHLPLLPETQVSPDAPAATLPPPQLPPVPLNPAQLDAWAEEAKRVIDAFTRTYKALFRPLLPESLASKTAHERRADYRQEVCEQLYWRAVKGWTWGQIAARYEREDDPSQARSGIRKRVIAAAKRLGISLK